MSRGRPKEFIREEALGRALETFWENGYTSTALSDLTCAMGIGRQSLYDTFGDKRALYMEALAAYCAEHHGRIQGLLQGEGRPGERLARFFDGWAEMLSGEMARGCMVVNSISEFVGDGDPEILKSLGGHMEQMARLVEGAIQEAIDAGDIDVGLDARELASTVMAAANGLALRARIHDTAAAARDVSRVLKRLMGL